MYKRQANIFKADNLDKDLAGTILWIINFTIPKDVTDIAVFIKNNRKKILEKLSTISLTKLSVIKKLCHDLQLSGHYEQLVLSEYSSKFIANLYISLLSIYEGGVEDVTRLIKKIRIYHDTDSRAFDLEASKYCQILCLQQYLKNKSTEVTIDEIKEILAFINEGNFNFVQLKEVFHFCKISLDDEKKQAVMEFFVSYLKRDLENVFWYDQEGKLSLIHI